MSVVSLLFCNPARGEPGAWRRQEGLLFAKRLGTFSFTRRHNSSSSAAESLPAACRMRIARGEAAQLSLCHLADLGISGCPVTLYNAGVL